MKKLNNWLRSVDRSLFPWRCIICGRKSVDCGICTSCKPILPWCRSVCRVCGLSLETVLCSDSLCGRCLVKRPYFNQIYAPLWYQSPINQLVTDFKYLGRWQNARTLATIFVQKIGEHDPSSIVIPVPNHPTRIRQRGFSPATELLKMLAKYLSIRVDYSVVKRILPSATQTGKSRDERIKNVKNAFQVCKDVTAKKIILFDDVVTTGATVNEISRILKIHGANKIEVWALARTKELS